MEMVLLMEILHRPDSPHAVRYKSVPKAVFAHPL